MMPHPDRPTFLPALGLRKGDVVSIIGGGGKTSLMFRLAREARSMGMRVLVTTSTKILIPTATDYDLLDLSGTLFSNRAITEPGIHVGGLPDNSPGKMHGVRDDLLAWQTGNFDLILIEADGSAGKPLKGWRQDEPVIVECTTMTIGVLDIQTIGKKVDDTLVHRLEIFSQLTGAQPGETITLGHLLRLIFHDEGLFAKALGRELLFVNKVETDDQRRQSDLLCAQLDNLSIVAGSLARGVLYD